MVYIMGTRGTQWERRGTRIGISMESTWFTSATTCYIISHGKILFYDTILSAFKSTVTTLFGGQVIPW